MSKDRRRSYAVDETMDINYVAIASYIKYDSNYDRYYEHRLRGSTNGALYKDLEILGSGSDNGVSYNPFTIGDYSYYFDRYSGYKLNLKNLGVEKLTPPSNYSEVYLVTSSGGLYAASDDDYLAYFSSVSEYINGNYSYCVLTSGSKITHSRSYCYKEVGDCIIIIGDATMYNIDMTSTFACYVSSDGINFKTITLTGTSGRLPGTIFDDRYHGGICGEGRNRFITENYLGVALCSYYSTCVYYYKTSDVVSLTDGSSIGYESSDSTYCGYAISDIIFRNKADGELVMFIHWDEIDTSTGDYLDDIYLYKYNVDISSSGTTSLSNVGLYYRATENPDGGYYDAWSKYGNFDYNGLSLCYAIPGTKYTSVKDLINSSELLPSSSHGMSNGCAGRVIKLPDTVRYRL